MTLRFGSFLPPFHELGQDPAYTFARDLDLAAWLDDLGLDELWVGEHHSGGWATISSPEVFLAAAAERTRRIALGTGVVSLPYHHPLMVANRILQLDNQTRGRIMFGAGAGVLTSDATMMGISPVDQRRMMAESLEVLLPLLAGEEPVTRKTDWFELRDARTQLRPYRPEGIEIAVASSGSPRGMRLAGEHGLSALTFAGGLPTGAPAPSLSALWQHAEDEAARTGRTVSRDRWRVIMSVYVGETRQQAYDDARAGVQRWLYDYFRDTIGVPVKVPEGREVETLVETNKALIGSVDDVTEGINRLLEDTGGFGTLVVTAQDWVSPEKLRRSYELLARHVVPRFQGRDDGVRASREWVSENRREFGALAAEAARAATAGNASR